MYSTRKGEMNSSKNFDHKVENLKILKSVVNSHFPFSTLPFLKNSLDISLFKFEL